MSTEKMLVTGAGGFIGFHVSQKLLEQGQAVVGIDSLNNYYDVQLKLDRLAILEKYPQFTFRQVDISDRAALESVFHQSAWDRVIHLAAQAGVRYSIDNPEVYIQANLVGFANILECCRNGEVKHLMYASSSSVYGDDTEPPFEEITASDSPVSLYAATKRSNELMAATYAHLYGMTITGMRFFTVYGPWGRPDMAYFTFTQAILRGEEIRLFNDGETSRDFTYIDDVVEAVLLLAKHSPVGHSIFNIGNQNPVSVVDFVEIISSALGMPAKTKYVEAQPGDVERTCASTVKLERATGFQPRTPLQTGISCFVKWYEEYFSGS